LPEISAQSGVAAGDSGGPKFAARKGVMLREYHVLVTWPDGRRMKVGQFPRRPDAALWIEQNSAGWLVQHQAAGMEATLAFLC